MILGFIFYFFILNFFPPSFCFHFLVFPIVSFESSFPFALLGALALGKFSLLSLCILVFFLVDHSSVRFSCPSISFFFVCLCHLLSLVGRARPKVGPFVGGTVYIGPFFLSFIP